MKNYFNFKYQYHQVYELKYFRKNLSILVIKGTTIGKIFEEKKNIGDKIKIIYFRNYVALAESIINVHVKFKIILFICGLVFKK